MCMATYVPAGRLPDTVALENGAWMNSDGHGAAVITNDYKIETFHSLDETEVIDWFAVKKAENIDRPGLFHSRIGTSGLINSGLANLHPFPVGSGSTVLAHNGILPDVFCPEKNDPRSDTAILCQDFLAGEAGHRYFLLTRSARRRLARIINKGYPNKLVILTVDPRFKQNSYLINAEAGIWDGGIWYSNTDYAGYSSYALGKTQTYDTFEEYAAKRPNLTTCSVCDAFDYSGSIRDYSVCSNCWICQDCGGVADFGGETLTCDCYTSPTVRTEITAL